MQNLGFVAIRQRTEQYAVYHREDSCVRADSQAECQDGENRVSTIALQSPSGVVKIAEHACEPAKAIHSPNLLTYLLRVTKFDIGLTARFTLIRAAAEILFDFECDVGLHFFFARLVPVIALKKSAPAHASPRSSSRSPITREIAFAICRHRVASEWSCFLPAFVSR